MKTKNTLDHYQTLGLSPKATKEEIRTAFKKLSQKLHPDKVNGSEESFSHIKKAYDTLSDPIKKAIYDTGVRQGFNPQEFKKSLDAVVEKTANHVCESLVKGQFFPEPSIKSLIKSHVVTERGQVGIQLNQMEQAQKKLTKALKRIKSGQETAIVKAILFKAETINQSITTLRMVLAVYDFFQDENKLIEMLEDKPQERLERRTGFNFETWS